MKTAREALVEHSKTFFNCRTLEQCDRFQIVEAQLRAFHCLQNGANVGSATVEENYAYARQLMGITEKDYCFG